MAAAKGTITMNTQATILATGAVLVALVAVILHSRAAQSLASALAKWISKRK